MPVSAISGPHGLVAVAVSLVQCHLVDVKKQDEAIKIGKLWSQGRNRHIMALTKLAKPYLEIKQGFVWIINLWKDL